MNNLLVDNPNKTWATLYANSLKLYNNLTVCGDSEFVGNVTFDNLNIDNLNPGPPNTFLHTNPAAQVVWEPIDTVAGVTGPTGPSGLNGMTGPTGPSGGDLNLYNSDGVVTDIRNVDINELALSFSNFRVLAMESTTDGATEKITSTWSNLGGSGFKLFISKLSKVTFPTNSESPHTVNLSYIFNELICKLDHPLLVGVKRLFTLII